jgi:hypothetical protein
LETGAPRVSRCEIEVSAPLRSAQNRGPLDLVRLAPVV